MDYKNNIVYDAYYLISLFNTDHRPITQLQAQKIMYFFEAYYMVIHQVDKLYECNFNAWAFGPVAIPLYQALKIFGENNIILTEEQKKLGESIDPEKKRILKYIYEVFGKLSAMKLVELTHMKDSPWDKKWKENGEKVVFGTASYIDKEETRDWFKRTFVRERKTDSD